MGYRGRYASPLDMLKHTQYHIRTLLICVFLAAILSLVASNYIRPSHLADVYTVIKSHTELIETDGDPDGVLHAQRARYWHCAGEYHRAKEDFEKSIQILPSERSRHLDYAWLLATCPNSKFRDGAEAIEHSILHFEIASGHFDDPVQLMSKNQLIRNAISQNRLCGEMDIFWKGWNWESLETLAAAFAENGEFGRAVIWQEMAINAFTNDGLPRGHLTTEDAENMNERLKLYQSKQKLRVKFREFR